MSAVRSGCVCAYVFVCLCVWRARLCTEGARCLQFDRAAHGSTTTTTGQSGPCQILLLKVTKKEEESRQPRKTPEESISFLQKDGSPADGFFPSGAGILESEYYQNEWYRMHNHMCSTPWPSDFWPDEETCASPISRDKDQLCISVCQMGSRISTPYQLRSFEM